MIHLWGVFLLTTPYKMKLKRRLYVPDTHAPFHDRRAWKIFLQVARDFKPEEVVILGDFFDCYTISAYTQDPKKGARVLADEIAEGTTVLQELISACRGASFVFIEGNHEDRIRRYIRENAPKLEGIIDTRDILRLPKDFHFVPWGPKNFYKAGKLVATHGSLCNKHVAHAMVTKYGASVIFGHVHRIQEYNVRNVHGERFKGITCGWLGDVDRAAEYVTNVADWSHGFALVWFKPNGDFFIQVVEIYNDQAVWEGKLIE